MALNKKSIAAQRAALKQENAALKRKTGMARVEVWEDITAWPLFIGAVLFTVVSTFVWMDNTMPRHVKNIAGAVLVGLWIWFIIDYVIRFFLAGKQRRLFVKSRAFDLVSLIIPYMRPFMILTYVWHLPSLRHGDARMQRRRYLITATLFAFLFVYVGSSAVWLVERGATNANIVDFGDAIWWGFTTISTVGYGDFVPVTVPGRTIAVIMMVGGIVVVGVIVATMISDLNDRIMGGAPAQRGAGATASGHGHHTERVERWHGERVERWHGERVRVQRGSA